MLLAWLSRTAPRSFSWSFSPCTLVFRRHTQRAPERAAREDKRRGGVCHPHDHIRTPTLSERPPISYGDVSPEDETRKPNQASRSADHGSSRETQGSKKERKRREEMPCVACSVVSYAGGSNPHPFLLLFSRRLRVFSGYVKTCLQLQMKRERKSPRPLCVRLSVRVWFESREKKKRISGKCTFVCVCG